MLTYTQKASAPLPSPLPASVAHRGPSLSRRARSDGEGQRNGRDATTPSYSEERWYGSPHCGSFAEEVSGQTIQTREGEVLT